MLKALWRWLWPSEAQPTRSRREDRYVTHEQLEEAIAQATKELEYSTNEWYEKFNALHLRLSKRDKRKQQQELELVEDEEQPHQRPSVLQYRRFGSV